MSIVNQRELHEGGGQVEESMEPDQAKALAFP